MTISLVARSHDPPMFGMAIASSSPAVAARCAHARAGVGVVATQNVTDPALGPGLLRALRDGASAEHALREVLRVNPHAAYRQLLVLGSSGSPAAHTGVHALGVAQVAIGVDAAAAGNLLARAEVPAAMLAAFDAASGAFVDRLLEGLAAGVACGGEAGPLHSAGLLIVREMSWPIVDLRIDWTDAQPVADLVALWQVYGPQVEDYVRRARDPSEAPSFGVPGDPASQ